MFNFEWNRRETRLQTNLQQRVDDLEARNQNFYAANRGMQREIEQCKGDYEQHEAQMSAHVQRNDYLEGECRKLKAMYHDARETRNAVQKELESVKKRNNRLVDKNLGLKESLVQQEEKIRETQEEILQMGEQATWAPEQDSVIGDELRNLEGLVKSFSKRSATVATNLHVLRRVWSTNDIGGNDIILGEGWCALGIPRLDEIAPWLLLSALLNRFICDNPRAALLLHGRV
jgi:chromosome segregation ATPase